MSHEAKGSMTRTPLETGTAIAAEFDYPITPDELWSYLTSSEGLEKWFPPHAHVTAGKDGLFAVSWSDRFGWVDRIVEWQPPNRFVIRPVEQEAVLPDTLEGLEVKVAANEDSPYAIEFDIRGREGGSTLRMVQSCFFRGDGWEDEVDSFFHGWEHQFTSLQHHLHFHEGEKRRFMRVEVMTEVESDDCWERLMGTGKPVGMRHDARSGEILQLNLGDESAITATVLRHTPNRQVIFDLPELNHSFLGFGVWRRPGTRWLVFDANLYGVTPRDAQRFEQNLRGLVANHFPETVAS